MTSRRTFLLGLGTALAAPSIVRAESLMKVAQLRSATPIYLGWDPATEFIATTDITVWRRIFYNAVNGKLVSEIIAPPNLKPGQHASRFT